MTFINHRELSFSSSSEVCFRVRYLHGLLLRLLIDFTFEKVGIKQWFCADIMGRGNSCVNIFFQFCYVGHVLTQALF